MVWCHLPSPPLVAFPRVALCLWFCTLCLWSLSFGICHLVLVTFPVSLLVVFRSLLLPMLMISPSSLLLVFHPFIPSPRLFSIPSLPFGMFLVLGLIGICVKFCGPGWVLLFPILLLPRVGVPLWWFLLLLVST